MTEGMSASDLLLIARRAVALVGASASCLSPLAASSQPLKCSWELLESAVRGAKGQDSGSASAVSTWTAIGGLRLAKQQLLRALRAPNMYRGMYAKQQRDGAIARQPRAILLYGPPGCGKTLLAQAAAAKCGLHGECIAGPQLLDKYIGASEKAVRAVFERARASGRPSLLIFDEFESLAPKRGRDNTGVTDRVVNQFLTFLDGVEDTMGVSSGSGSNKEKGSTIGNGEGEEGEGEAEDHRGGQVFVIAATSRPDLIDAALLRPGRIEVHVYLGLPDTTERKQVLWTALQPLLSQTCAAPLSSDLELAIASVCSDPRAHGFCSSDFCAVASTAFLLATHEHMHAGTAGQVQLNGSHILRAFASTRASLSPKDRDFYAEVHGKFRKGTDSAKNANGTASANTSASATARAGVDSKYVPAALASGTIVSHASATAGAGNTAKNKQRGCPHPTPLHETHETTESEAGVMPLGHEGAGKIGGGEFASQTASHAWSVSAVPRTALM